MDNNITILKSLKNSLVTNSGSLTDIIFDSKEMINNETMSLMSKPVWNKEDVEKGVLIIQISNNLYNNSDLDILLLDDGVYDLLLEKVREYVPDIQSGATPQNLAGSAYQFMETEEAKMSNPIMHVSDDEIEKMNNMMFPSIINIRREFNSNDVFAKDLLPESNDVTKRLRNTQHEHPELVGTLHKSKFVLSADAIERGVFNQSNVVVLERDWIAPMILSNIIKPTDQLDVILSLKYDGISIEADVNTEVISARTRGDTDLEKASDLTPIFKGYKFPNAVDLGETIGMKFEAIVSYNNLDNINRLTGNHYVNGRTAIIGILGRSDSYRYRDFITLVPLQTSLKDENGEPLDRLVEIEFMNRYYTREIMFKHQTISGNYQSILFQIKRYAEEAEFARSFLPFMYDGIVVEMYDPEIRKKLGRKNSIDQYKMAVKFNPMRRHSVFRGYKYSIGQSGMIVPMFYFDPVEFLGAIHDHTTGYSYEHFNKLNLYKGDVIDIDYNHDVMPYVSKPDIQFNRDNHNRPPEADEVFPDKCPFCGGKITISKSGKAAYCMNLHCVGKEAKRISNMVSKLGIKDIAEERMAALGVGSLKELYDYPYDKMVEIIGPTNAAKFKDQLDSIKNNETPDYILIGALGFSNLSAKTWRIIFEKIALVDIIQYLDGGYVDDVKDMFCTIKGIGPNTTETIIEEWNSFKDDIHFIVNEFNYKNSYGSFKIRKKIRFTGFRDKDLESILDEMGYDADGNAGVTKDTAILLVPYDGYNQGSKCEKALKYNIKMMTVNDFKNYIGLETKSF